MARVYADRVMETSTTTGFASLVLAANVAGYQRFNTAMSVGDTCDYAVYAVDSHGTPTGDWETGRGTYSAPNTLTRTEVLQSTNGDLLVNFAAGTKQVLLTPNAATLADIQNGGTGVAPVLTPPTIPAVRGALYSTYTSTTAPVVTLPTGTVAGDTVYVIAQAASAITAPAGWAVVDTQSLSGNFGATFRRIVDATDITAGGVTLTLGSAGTGYTAAVSIIGRDGALRVAAQAQIVNASSANLGFTTSPLTNSFDRVLTAALSQGNVAISAVYGTPIVAVQSAGGSVSVESGVGATGGVVQTYSFSTATNLYAVALVLRPRAVPFVGKSYVPPRTRVTLSADQLIPRDGNWHAAAWDTEVADDLKAHDLVTNPERITVPAGVTKVKLLAHVIYNGEESGSRASAIAKNGADYTFAIESVWPQRSWVSGHILDTGWIDCIPGDYFTLVTTVAASNNVYFSASGIAVGGCFMEALFDDNTAGGGRASSTETFETIYTKAMAKSIALHPTFNAGELRDLVTDKGGFVVMTLNANTNAGFSTRATGSTFTVPDGAIAVVVGGVFEESFQTSAAFYKHRLYNLTQGTILASPGGNLSADANCYVPNSYAAKRSWIATTDVGGSSPNAAAEPFAVAGDVLQAQAWTSGDGNYRVQQGSYFIALVDAVTGNLLPVTGVGGSGGGGSEWVTLAHWDGSVDADLTTDLISGDLTGYSEVEALIGQVVTTTNSTRSMLVSNDGGATYDTSASYLCELNTSGGHNFNDSAAYQNGASFGPSTMYWRLAGINQPGMHIIQGNRPTVHVGVLPITGLKVSLGGATATDGYISIRAKV